MLPPLNHHLAGLMVAVALAIVVAPAPVEPAPVPLYVVAASFQSAFVLLLTTVRGND